MLQYHNSYLLSSCIDVFEILSDIVWELPKTGWNEARMATLIELPMAAYVTQEIIFFFFFFTFGKIQG